MQEYHPADFSCLLGHIIKNVIGLNKGSPMVDIEMEDGSVYVLHHNQYCCESVEVADITGDIKDIIGSPLLMAEVVTNSDEARPEEWTESWT